MRTKTYIAADFDYDINAVDILYYWKNNQSLSFDFQDAHDLTQARDTSLPCSIKSSLRYRLTESKTFVLIVGEHTDSLTKGGCQFCPSYNSYNYHCARDHEVDYRSYIHYECDMAKQDYLTSEIKKIVVLYNNTVVNKQLCPETLQSVGTHIPMIYYSVIDGKYHWDYQKLRKY